MLTVIGPVLAVVIVVASLMAIVGQFRSAMKLVGLAVVGGVVASFMPAYLPNAGVGIERLDVELVVVVVGLVLGIILVATAYVRFITRNRRVKKWFAGGEKPTSLKRRVDRE